MSLWLFPVVVAAAAAAAAPPRTFADTDPITGRPLVCDQCPPGQYLGAKCTATQKSVCLSCPTGSFTELWNYIGKCLRCGVCARDQVEKTPCTEDRDCECECKPGYYFRKDYDMCLPHSRCQTGYEVLTAGTADVDTVCRPCSNTSFSDSASDEQRCTEHRRCDAAGQRLVLKGATWHDSICTSCEELRSKDGADYLKEILPAFFAHQKLSFRRLQRLVQKLPVENGRRVAAATGLDSAGLHERVNTWVASATVTQIRQLPAILRKVRAESAGDRLDSKLQRIDSNLAELCDSGNEVDGSL